MEHPTTGENPPKETEKGLKTVATKKKTTIYHTHNGSLMTIDPVRETDPSAFIAIKPTDETREEGHTNDHGKSEISGGRYFSPHGPNVDLGHPAGAEAC